MSEVGTVGALSPRSAWWRARAAPDRKHRHKRFLRQMAVSEMVLFGQKSRRQRGQSECPLTAKSRKRTKSLLGAIKRASFYLGPASEIIGHSRVAFSAATRSSLFSALI